MAENLQFGPFWARLAQIWDATFFSENLYSALQIVYNRLTTAKNQKNLMMGSTRTRVTDGQTDRRTDTT